MDVDPFPIDRLVVRCLAELKRYLDDMDAARDAERMVRPEAELENQTQACCVAGCDRQVISGISYGRCEVHCSCRYYRPSECEPAKPADCAAAPTLVPDFEVGDVVAHKADPDTPMVVSDLMDGDGRFGCIRKRVTPDHIASDDSFGCRRFMYWELEFFERRGGSGVESMVRNPRHYRKPVTESEKAVQV